MTTGLTGAPEGWAVVDDIRSVFHEAGSAIWVSGYLLM